LCTPFGASEQQLDKRLYAGFIAAFVVTVFTLVKAIFIKDRLDPIKLSQWLGGTTRRAHIHACVASQLQLFCARSAYKARTLNWGEPGSLYAQFGSLFL